MECLGFHTDFTDLTDFQFSSDDSHYLFCDFCDFCVTPFSLCDLVYNAIYGHQYVVCVEVDKKSYLLVHQSEVSKKLFCKHLLHFLD